MGINMKTILILGGEIQKDFALSFYKSESFDRVIAVDGGLVCLDSLGIVPTDIVGDFDTVPYEILAKYQNRRDVCIRRYDPEKDATDSQIAMELAISSGSSEIYILGATGTRLDHTLGNIHLLALPLNAGIPCFIVDPHNRIRLIQEETMLIKKRQYGTYVSLLPFTSLVEGITLKGFKYPLTNYRMDINANYTLGISNELSAEKAVISLASGILILMETKD